MYVVVNDNGRVVASGETDSLVAPAGGEVVEWASDPLDGLAAGEEAYWNGAKFSKRQRVLGADEQARREDAATLKAYRTTPKANITAGMTVDAIWALTDIMRGVVAELRDD